jgi:thioredoxin 1
MSEIKTLTSDSFEGEIASGATVVDFYADWCGPCKMMAPVFDEAAETFGDKVKFAKLNIDDNRQIAIANNVMSIPTLIFFKDGQVVDRTNGVITGQILEAKLNGLL